MPLAISQSLQAPAVEMRPHCRDCGNRLRLQVVVGGGHCSHCGGQRVCDLNGHRLPAPIVLH